MEYVTVGAGAVIRQKPGGVKLGKVESATQMPLLSGPVYSGYTYVDSRWGAGYVENQYVTYPTPQPPPVEPPPVEPPPPGGAPSIDHIQVVYSDGSEERFVAG